MERTRSQTLGGNARRGGAVLAVSLLVAAGAVACRQPPAMLRSEEARHRVAELTVQFTRASEATNRAVMAESDETSPSFAAQARAASGAAQAQLDAVTALLRGLGYQPEGTLVDDFSACFARYRALEATVLDLAVQNTNVKARRLSFGPASQRADEVAAALDRAAAANRDWRVHATASDAMVALRELQMLQAHHIAEPEDAAMTRIEERMKVAEDRVSRSLAQLAGSVAPSARTEVAKAADGFAAFIAVHHDILALSRQNTNVRSLALALNDMGKMTQACDERLSALGQALQEHAAFGSR